VSWFPKLSEWLGQTVSRLPPNLLLGAPRMSQIDMS